MERNSNDQKRLLSSQRAEPSFCRHHETRRHLPRHEARNQKQRAFTLIGLIFFAILDNAPSDGELVEHKVGEGHRLPRWLIAFDADKVGHGRPRVHVVGDLVPGARASAALQEPQLLRDFF